ncbi:unnamed protein product [Ambrosiozyma monospora]|uniref:Unnamed protein product n=1 Tax=Ambrosiozyma monospora TaxID=43982 RepID=A0ACB5SY22_AMBMO|nr:unnamed protein product [Ambrosiozyma monospora]
MLDSITYAYINKLELSAASKLIQNLSSKLSSLDAHICTQKGIFAITEENFSLQHLTNLHDAHLTISTAEYVSNFSPSLLPKSIQKLELRQELTENMEDPYSHQVNINFTFRDDDLFKFANDNEGVISSNLYGSHLTLDLNNLNAQRIKTIDIPHLRYVYNVKLGKIPDTLSDFKMNHKDRVTIEVPELTDTVMSCGLTRYKSNLWVGGDFGSPAQVV